MGQIALLIDIELSVLTVRWHKTCHPTRHIIHKKGRPLVVLSVNAQRQAGRHIYLF